MDAIEEKCVRCNGVGFIWVDRNYTQTASCPSCKGRGETLTTEGYQFMDMINKHLENFK